MSTHPFLTPFSPDPRCQLIVVLLPFKAVGIGGVYAEVKQAGDSILSIPTQCVVCPKAGIGRDAMPPKGRLQYVANLALKVNAKMGGVNVKLVGQNTLVSGGAGVRGLGAKGG